MLQIMYRFDTDIPLLAIDEDNFIAVNFRYEDLRWAYLAGKQFRYADFCRADLRFATLTESNLMHTYCKEADFLGADLSGVQFGGADLSGADLRCTDLSATNFVGATLYKTNLRRATFSKADRWANLENANFEAADFSYADLRKIKVGGTNFKRANFDNAILNWECLEILSEILYQHAETDSQRMYCAYTKSFPYTAGGITFINKHHHSEKEWGLKVLAQYIQEGDNAPEIIKEIQQ